MKLYPEYLDPLPLLETDYMSEELSKLSESDKEQQRQLTAQVREKLRAKREEIGRSCHARLRDRVLMSVRPSR